MFPKDRFPQEFAQAMRVLSRVCLASGTLLAVLFLGGCQGLVTPPTTPPPAAQPSKVTVALAGSGSGTVTSAPAGINCGTTCTADFADGAITLTAAPGTSFVFTGWSGDCTGTGPCTIPAGSTATATATFTATLQSINHIIFLLQENRSFDHYFGHMNEYRLNLGLGADVDGTPVNASNPTFDMTSTITPFHMVSMCVENPSPSWNESHKDFNRDNPTSMTPLLDGFVWTGAHFAMDSGEQDIAGRRVMGYYDSNDLPFYYFMATNFAMSDRWFSPVLTRTQPNRMFSIAATSDGHVYPLMTGDKSSKKTIFELLQDAGISWRVYVADGSPTLIEGSDLVMFAFADSHPENFVVASQFPPDVASGNLPQVVFISEGRGTDEHPAEPGAPGGSVQTGSSYVRDTFLEPLLRSPLWKDSVFVLSWDEGGGFYDHFPPQAAVPPDDVAISDLAATDFCFGMPASPTNNCGFNHTGYRVPMMLISPFSKKNYVSHAIADHTAVLKLIETRFGLPNLTERDKAQIDMSAEFFDFVNAPWMTPPPTTPAQPSPGQCDFTLP
jgi:phospholipase C